MAYNKFSIHIITRIILIVVNCFFLVTEYIIRDYYFTIINLAILLLLQTILLIRYVRKTNLQIIDYFDLIKSKESGFRLNDAESKNSFSKVRKSFNETSRIIQDIRIEKEVQSNYLNHIVNHVNIGLFSFDKTEKIQFINPEAKRILRIENAFKIDDLKHLNNQFPEFLRQIKPGESKVIEVKSQTTNQKLSINCGVFNLRNENIKLISFHDIDKHLYKNEIESWNRLIKILNHEIMNSITPITSLTKTIKKYFHDDDEIKDLSNITPISINKTVEGLDIIEERGLGLINFVNNYRRLSSLPKPKKSEFSVCKLLNHVKDLFIDEIKSQNIDLKIELKTDDLILFADKDQIAQVLINIIRNSFDAVKGNKKGEIRINALKKENEIILSIADNGTGIPSEILNDIFIPFYTTKNSGSGIGLSLSKQILKMHDGTISVASTPFEKTEFILHLGNN